MRVGVIGPPQADQFADNIVSSLGQMGLDGVALGAVKQSFGHRRVDAALSLFTENFASANGQLQKAIVRRAIDAEVDTVITVDATMLPSTVAALRQAGMKVALWFPDHLANLGRQYMIAADYDRLYFKDQTLVDRLVTVYGLPAAYMPEACNPLWHAPAGEPGVDGGLVLAGNLYATRVRLLDRLHADGLPLRLYGAGWPSVVPNVKVTALPVAPPVHRAEKAQVFRQAAGVLNNLHPSELTGVNCRLFEAAGSGAAVLCEDRPALRELFDVGTEVLAFSTYDGLVTQARGLLEDPALTRKVGNAAAARARAEHTYIHRLSRILGDLV